MNPWLDPVRTKPKEALEEGGRRENITQVRPIMHA
jgi:hypothetical protein